MTKLEVDPLSSPEPRSNLFPPDLDVLRYLPWDCSPEATPVRFSDNRWQLNAIGPWPVGPDNFIVWTPIESPTLRVTAKEVALALMQPSVGLKARLPLPRRKPYPPWAVPSQLVHYWTRLFNHMEAEGVQSLSELDQRICDSYLASIGPGSRDIAITAVRQFSHFAPILTHDAMRGGFVPWGCSSAAAAAGISRGGGVNKTSVIPDRVFGPLVAACLKLVDEAQRMPSASLRVVANTPGITAKQARGGAPHPFDDRLDAYLNNLRTNGGQLPLWSHSRRSHPINLSAVAEAIGMADPRHLTRPDRWSRLTEAADTLGYTMAGSQRARGDSGADQNQRTRWLMLTACYVIVAAISGMRTSEMSAIRRGAGRREELDNGGVRFRIDSMLLKGEPPGGRRETWTVIEEVWRALRVAETLTTAEHPFMQLGRSFQAPYQSLRRWVNSAGAALDLEPIPEDWKLTPRQFRRTLARELGWRPGGVIAGKLHLKHISVVTTEGYVGERGESFSAFVAEVEHETRLSSERAAAEALQAIQRGEPVTGLALPELAALVRTLSEDVAGEPRTRDRLDPLYAIAKKVGEKLHRMPVAHCWFTHPERARCLRGVGDKSRPIVGLCRPSECVNATIHSEHLGVWLGGIDALRATARDPKMPEGERRRAKEQADEDLRIIEPLLGGHP